MVRTSRLPLLSVLLVGLYPNALPRYLSHSARLREGKENTELDDARYNETQFSLRLSCDAIEVHGLAMMAKLPGWVLGKNTGSSAVTCLNVTKSFFCCLKYVLWE